VNDFSSLESPITTVVTLERDVLADGAPAVPCAATHFPGLSLEVLRDVYADCHFAPVEEPRNFECAVV
jgi:hypothetical protein